MAERVKRLSTMRETWARLLGREDPLDKEMATHCGTLTCQVPQMEKPVGYSPCGRKESDTMERLHFSFFLLYKASPQLQ